MPPPKKNGRKKAISKDTITEDEIGVKKEAATGRGKRKPVVTAVSSDEESRSSDEVHLNAKKKKLSVAKETIVAMPEDKATGGRKPVGFKPKRNPPRAVSTNPRDDEKGRDEKKNGKRSPVLSSSDTNEIESSDEKSVLNGEHNAKGDENRDASPEQNDETLDSYPPIADSGRARNKWITNNPLTIEKSDIDPMHRKIFARLPPLRDSELVPYGRHATEDHFMLVYSDIYDGITSKTQQRILDAAINFSAALPFINPSRADPSLVKIEAGRMLIQESQGRNKPVVLMTTGIIVESFLKMADTGVSANGTNYKVRQVLLNPFSGEYERLAAFIGTTYDVEHYSCQLEKACLFFATRREGSGTDVNEYYQNGSSGARASSSARAQGGSRASKAVKPIKKPSNYNCDPYFSASLGFKDDVPVYDMRKQTEFAFRSDELRSFRKLPLYNDRNNDLEPEAYVATIGYTVSSWIVNGDTRAIGLNLQFIMLLADNPTDLLESS